MILELLFAATLVQPTSALPGDVVLPGQTAVPSPSTTHFRSLSLLVLDPGHGGEDSGVKATAGPTEKDLALTLAKRLEGKLEGETRVLLTRQGDSAMPATERASFANQAKAALFISLHAGSSLAPGARGFAVYYHDPSGAAAEAATAGAGSPGSLPFALSWSAAQRGVEAESAELATLVHDSLAEKAVLEDRGVHRLPLATLEGVTCPAVEVELGVLSNAEDALALSSDAVQEDLASALAAAVERMDAARQGGTP